MIVNLSVVALLTGIIFAAAGAFCLGWSGKAQDLCRRFPRLRYAGWGLAAIDSIWAGILVNRMPLGSYDAWKPALFVLVPVLLVVAGVAMAELLAARALGGLLLLIPKPMMDAAQGHESAWRLLVIALAYAMVVQGVILTLNPYVFRKQCEFWSKTKVRWNLFACGFLVAGACFTALALTVYR